MTHLTQRERERREREEQRNYGYRLFEAGQPETLCTNSEQRVGYRSALNACAYASTSEYLVQRGIVR
jgi:hypothetical protein